MPKGSVALADGRLYYRTENGTVMLVEPNPQHYIERGRFEQPDRSDRPAWRTRSSPTANCTCETRTCCCATT